MLRSSLLSSPSRNVAMRLPAPRQITYDIDDLDMDNGSDFADEFVDEASRVGKAQLEGAELRRYNREMAELYGFTKKSKGLLHLYQMIGMAGRLLGHWFITDITAPSWALGNPEAASAAYSKADYIETKSNNRVLTSLGAKIKKDGDFVKRTFTMRGYSGVIDPAASDDRMSEAAKIIKTFFPAAEFSRVWTKNVDPQTYRTTYTGGASGDETYTLNEIITKTMKMSSDIRAKSGTFKMDVPRNFIKHWGKLVDIRMRLASTPAAYGQNHEGSTLRTNDNALYPFAINVEVTINFPLEGAMWMTSCDDPDDFSLLTMFHHIRNFEMSALTDLKEDNRKFKLYDKSASPASSVRSMSDFSKVVGTVPPRQNDQGFTIRMDGKVIFTGMEADLDSYSRGEQESYDAESGEFRIDKILSSSAAYSLLAIDWQGNTIIYTGARGNVEFMDLQGSQTLSDVDIGDNLLTHKEYIPTEALSNLCKWAGVSHVLLPAKLGSKPSEYVPMSPKELWDDLDADEDYYTRNSVENFRVMIGKLYEKFDSLSMPLPYRINYRYGVWLYGYYAKPENRGRYLSACAAQEESVSAKVEPQNPIKVYSMDGVRHFYPHQTALLGDLQTRLPKDALIGVDAGGGKTAIYISALTNYINSGVVKRPLIVTPGNLKSQFGEEINAFTKAGWRVFPLFRSSWDRLHRQLGISLAQLRKIIESQPKNTLFITDYGFLKLRPKSIRVGYGGEQRSFGFAVWASQIFDMIVADESHKVKTIASSDIGAAFRTLTPYMKVKLQGSGTTLFNNPRDLMGQMSTYSPNILGDDLSKYEEYTGKIADDKVQEFTDRIHKYVKIYNANKRKWSFLLPKINYFMHEASMPEVMQAKYESVFKKLMEELEKALIAAGIDVKDEKNDDKIASKAKEHLAPLEIFINAPDCFLDAKGASDDELRSGAEKISQEYLSLPGVKADKRLWKSPKIDIMDKIIDKHFATTKAKVIVMSYNLAISRHVMRRSRHAADMLHYTAAEAKKTDLVKEFIENPKYKILVADENTIKEGFNIQCASRLIRIQTIFTVGEYQQALARVERPDDINPDGSTRYGREAIDFDWIITSPSLDVLKTARLFTKIMEKTKIDEYRDNIRYRHWMYGKPIEGPPFNGVNFTTKIIVGGKEVEVGVPELMAMTNGKLTLSPDNFAILDSFDKLSAYQGLYKLYNKWLDLETIRETDILRKKLSESTGVPIDKLTDNKLRLSAMSQPERLQLPGGKKFQILDGYVPFLQGVSPPDPYNLGLIPVAKVIDSGVEEDDDAASESDNDDEKNVQIQVTLRPGDIVVSEFGITKVESIRKGGASINIDIPEGRGTRSVRVGMQYVFIPEDLKDRERLRRIYESLQRANKPTTTMSFDKGVVNMQAVDIGAKGPAMPPKAIAPVKLDDIDELIEAPTPRVRIPVVPPRAPVIGGSSAPIVRPTIGGAAAAPKQPIGSRPRPTPPPVPAPAPKIKSPAPMQPKPNTERSKMPRINLQCAMVNNQRCLMGFPHSGGERLTDIGFKHINRTVSARIRTWQGLNALITYLDDYFDFDQDHLDAMEQQLEVFHKTPKQLARILPAKTNTFIRKFLIENTRKPKNPRTIFPFLVYIDGELALVINCDVSPAAFKLNKVKAVRGVDAFVAQEDLYIKFYNSFQSFEDDIFDQIDKKFVLSNVKEFSEQLRKIPGDELERRAKIENVKARQSAPTAVRTPAAPQKLRAPAVSPKVEAEPKIKPKIGSNMRIPEKPKGKPRIGSRMRIPEKPRR